MIVQHAVSALLYILGVLILPRFFAIIQVKLTPFLLSP